MTLCKDCHRIEHETTIDQEYPNRFYYTKPKVNPAYIGIGGLEIPDD